MGRKKVSKHIDRIVQAELNRNDGVRVIRQPRPNAKNIVTVDAEVWAASGGTAGLYGKAWREGRLKIVSEGE